MIIKVQTEVTAPDGSTHYFGNLLDEPTFVKMIMVGDFEHWFTYQPRQKVWVLLGHTMPRWVKHISNTTIHEAKP